ncbi:MAG: VWA domain-containing protein [Ruminococcaceae bacterium]|nr:VWA domain-containing protein [Oscillospiraceae bacterium]
MSLAAVLLLTVTAGCSGSAEYAADVEAEAPMVMESYAETTTDFAYPMNGSFDDYAIETPDFNTEEYNTIVENRFLSVVTSPLSTFSADVDTASYTNVRRYIDDKELPPADAVRIEELLNYFTYDYPEPDGDEPFSVTTEISDCPWNADTKLLLIGLQAEKPDTEQLPPSNLVFLIDVSGSMDSADKLPLVKEAFMLLTEQLGENDRVSIVTYASSDKVVLKGATGEDKQDIMDAINLLQAGGATAGSDGIKTAYKLAEEYFIEGGNNRVILATDGDLNVGVTSEGELTRLVEKKRESGVFLSVMGFGTGNIKDNKMEALADNGNGSYHYIDSENEARRVLVEEMGGTLFTVAKDVKFQVEFNPAVIKGYRLIGYENRVMEAEDFDDDTKDAGEIGAGHRVTALYEIVEVDSPMEIAAPELTYQTSGDSGSDEYLQLKVRYKEPDGDTSKLLTYPVGQDAYTAEPSNDFVFASAVAQYGMLLRQSAYSGTATYESILEQLNSRLGLLSDDYRYDFRRIVEHTAMIAELESFSVSASDAE